MHVVFWVALVLFVAGAALLALAYFNPRWQSAESYDAVLPFVVGAVFALVGMVAAVCGWVAKAAGWLA